MTSPNSKRDIKEEDLCHDERTVSETACILLQAATLLSCATDPSALGLALGFSASQVAEIDGGFEESKDKVLHLLQRFTERRGDDWSEMLKEIIENKLQDRGLATKVHNVTSKGAKLPERQISEDLPGMEKGSVKDVSVDKPQSPASQELCSDHTEWELPSGGHHDRRSQGGTQEAPLSPSFERVSEEHVFMLRDGEPEHQNQGPHTSLDHPEMSLQISRVGEALQMVSDLLGNQEGINELPQVIPQILKLARKMRTQKILRTVFQEENLTLKQSLDKANEIIQELSTKIEKVESENAELKKAAEDKSLKSFEYVTRKEARDIREQEQKEQEKAQQAAAPSLPKPSGGVAVEAYESLQKKNISLKQKLAQVVKLNHSWDDEYHHMEAVLRQEISRAQQEVVVSAARMEEKKQDWVQREKDRDEILVACKQRVDQAEAQQAEMQVLVNQQNEEIIKLNRYTVSLQEFKQDLEIEVKRLNDALEQKVQVAEKSARLAPSQAVVTGVAAAMAPLAGVRARKAKTGGPLDLTSHQERSMLESMPQESLLEELGLLKQQVDVYKSDFYKEQTDRQRAMGELDEIKTELHRTKKKVEKQKQQMQILQDQALAFEYQAKENKMGPPLPPYRPRTTSKSRLSQQDNVFEVLQGPRSPSYYQQVRPRQSKKDLLPHGVNYAMNDEFVDAYEEPFDDLEVYLPPASNQERPSSGDEMYLSPTPSPVKPKGGEHRTASKYTRNYYEN